LLLLLPSLSLSSSTTLLLFLLLLLLRCCCALLPLLDALGSCARRAACDEAAGTRVDGWGCTDSQDWLAQTRRHSPPLHDPYILAHAHARWLTLAARQLGSCPATGSGAEADVLQRQPGLRLSAACARARGIRIWLAGCAAVVAGLYRPARADAGVLRRSCGCYPDCGPPRGWAEGSGPANGWLAVRLSLLGFTDRHGMTPAF
jgi:hypothetical protein